MKDEIIADRFGRFEEVAGVYSRMGEGDEKEYWVTYFGDASEICLIEKLISAESEVLNQFPDEVISFHYLPVGPGLPAAAKAFGNPIYERGAEQCQ